MAYPYIVPASGSFFYMAYPLSEGPRYRSSTGYLYATLTKYANPNQTISMYRSTDAGLTSAEVDPGNRPAASFGPGNGAFATWDDGTRIWSCYLPSGGASAVMAFNTSTNLWETAITGGPSPTDANAPSSMNPNKQLGVIVRSNGDIVVIYSVKTTITAVDYNSLYGYVYSGGSWSGPIDLLVAGNEETGSGTDYSFDFLGATLGDSDRIVIWASTTRGYACKTLFSDNTTGNYRRDDRDSIASLTLGHRNGVWGTPATCTFGSQKYHALPVAWQSDLNGVSSQLTPGVIMLEDSATPGALRSDRMESYPVLAANYNSVCIAPDIANKTAYLVWTAGATFANYQTTLTIACTKGFGFNAPSTLFQTGSNQLVESMSATAEGGKIRLLIENYQGNSPYTDTHYYQSDVTCAAGGCAASSGNINSAR